MGQWHGTNVETGHQTICFQRGERSKSKDAQQKCIITLTLMMSLGDANSLHILLTCCRDLQSPCYYSRHGTHQNKCSHWPWNLYLVGGSKMTDTYAFSKKFKILINFTGKRGRELLREAWLLSPGRHVNPNQSSKFRCVSARVPEGVHGKVGWGAAARTHQ